MLLAVEIMNLNSPVLRCEGDYELIGLVGRRLLRNMCELATLIICAVVSVVSLIIAFMCQHLIKIISLHSFLFYFNH